MRDYLKRRKFRFAVAVAAAVLTAGVLGLAQAASAVTYHTMRPAGNSAYCVADDSGGGGYVSLVNPCNQGSFEAWGVSGSPYLGGGLEQIRNQATGDCLQTAGYQVKLATARCNGDEAQAWFEIRISGTVTVWQSPYQHNGTYLCADASTVYGVRAWACNGTGAQDWYGPE